MISVVIPTYNRAALLDRCLDHLSRQTLGPREFEVIVVDDASTDHTPSVIERWSGDGRVPCRGIRASKGFAGAARNRGAAEAHGARLLFLGDDILAAPNLVEMHLRAAERAGAGTAFVGEVSYPTEQRTAFMRFLEAEGVHHAFPQLHATGDQALDGRYFYACNASLDKEEFARVGGFDETIKRAWEDTEFGVRFVAAGHELRFLPEARGSHIHPITLAQYVRFLRAGRDDIARASSLMATHGYLAPELEEHAVLDRVVGDRLIEVAAHVADRVAGGLPDRAGRKMFRKVLRYERRRSLQLAARRASPAHH